MLFLTLLSLLSTYDHDYVHDDKYASHYRYNEEHIYHHGVVLLHFVQFTDKKDVFLHLVIFLTLTGFKSFLGEEPA